MIVNYSIFEYWNNGPKLWNIVKISQTVFMCVGICFLLCMIIFKIDKYYGHRRFSLNYVSCLFCKY